MPPRESPVTSVGRSCGSRRYSSSVCHSERLHREHSAVHNFRELVASVWSVERSSPCRGETTWGRFHPHIEPHGRCNSSTICAAGPDCARRCLLPGAHGAGAATSNSRQCEFAPGVREGGLATAGCAKQRRDCSEAVARGAFESHMET